MNGLLLALLLAGGSISGGGRNVEMGPLHPSPLLRMNFESGSCVDSVSGDTCLEVDDGANADCDDEATACPIAGTLSGYVVGGTTFAPAGSTDLIKDDAGLAISTPLTLHWKMQWDGITTRSAGAKVQGGLWQDDDSFACRLMAGNVGGDFTVSAKCNNSEGAGCVLANSPLEVGEDHYPRDVRLYYDTPNDDCTIIVDDCTVTCNGSSSGVLVDGWAMGADRTGSDVAFDNIGLCSGVVLPGVKCGDPF